MGNRWNATVYALMFIASNAWAGPYEDAITAYKRGDFSVAAKHYRLAAEQGDALAQNDLGVLYERGQGVMQDYGQAVKWYRLAAAQGDASGQFALGVMYDKGQGVVQDYLEARKWYRLAAEQGKTSAHYNLAVMLALGRGVPVDIVRAHSWFNIAAMYGDADAVKGRDITAKQMTPQQIVDAQKLARECLERNFRGCD